MTSQTIDLYILKCIEKLNEIKKIVEQVLMVNNQKHFTMDIIYVIQKLQSKLHKNSNFQFVAFHIIILCSNWI